MSGTEPLAQMIDVDEVRERAQQAATAFADYLATGNPESRETFLRIFRTRGDAATVVAFNTEFDRDFVETVRSVDVNEEYITLWLANHHGNMNYVNLINDVYELHNHGRELADIIGSVLTTGSQEAVRRFQDAFRAELFPEAGLRRRNLFFARGFSQRFQQYRDEDERFRRVESAYRFSTKHVAGAIHACYRELGREGRDEEAIRRLRREHGSGFVDAFLEFRGEVDLEGRTPLQIEEYLRAHRTDDLVVSMKEGRDYNISDLVRDVGAIYGALQGDEFPTVEQIRELNGRYGTDIVDAIRVVGSIPRPIEGRRAEEEREAHIEDARRRVRGGITLVDEIEDFLEDRTIRNPEGETVPLTSVPLIQELLTEYREISRRLEEMRGFNDRQVYQHRDEIRRLRRSLPSLANLVGQINDAIQDGRNFRMLYYGERRFLHTLSPMWFSRAESMFERIEHRRGRFGGLYTAIFDSYMGGEERFRDMRELVMYMGPRVATLMANYLELGAEIGSEEIPSEGQPLIGTETGDRLDNFEEAFNELRERLAREDPEVRDDLLSRLSVQFYSQWHLDYASDAVDEARPYAVAIEAHQRLIGDRNFMQGRLDLLTMFTERPLDIDRPVGAESRTEEGTERVDGAEVADAFANLSLPAQYELVRIARLMGGGALERISDEHLLSLAVIVRGITNHSPAYTPCMLRQIGRDLVEQLEPQQVETVVNFIMTFESTFVRTGDYEGLQSWYSVLPSRLRQLMRVTARSLTMETREGGEESMDVRIRMPSENEEYATVMTPGGQVLFQIPIHVYTAWRTNGTIEIPPAVREMLPPNIRDSAAPTPSILATEQRYFEGRIIEAVVHRPNPYIRLPVTLENLRVLAPDTLPEVGPMFEWENSVAGDWEYVGDNWLGGATITDEWEGFGPTIFTELSGRGSETLTRLAAESRGESIGNQTMLWNWEADIDVGIIRNELAEGGEQTEIVDEEEIALSMIAPRGTNAAIYFRRDEEGRMRGQLYTMAGGVLVRGDYIELTEEEAQQLYSQQFSADEQAVVRREYGEAGYTSAGGQLGLDQCVLFFGSGESAASALQGIAAWGEIGRETHGMVGGQVESTREGRAMAQAGAISPSDRWFAIGRVYLSGLGIDGILPEGVEATEGDTETIGDHVQVEGWVLRSQRYTVRAFGDFLLQQMEESRELIGGGWGALTRVLQDSYGWGAGTIGAVRVEDEQTHLDRLGFSGYWVRREVTDAVVASLLFEDGVSTVRATGGFVYNIVPSTLVMEIIGGYERGAEETDEEEVDDEITVPLGTDDVEIPEGQRYAAALRIRWTPQGEARLDAVEGLGIIYQRDEELVPVVGMELETDDDAYVHADIEAYWLGLTGGAAAGHLTIGNVDLSFGGGTTLSGGYGMHGGVRLRLGGGRITLFAVGSGEYDAELADSTDLDEELEDAEIIEDEVETTEDETEDTLEDLETIGEDAAEEIEEPDRATVITGMLGARVRLSDDSAGGPVTTLGVAASTLVELFAGEEEAWQIDLQMALRRRDALRSLEATVGYTHWQGIDEWDDSISLGLRYRSETSWGRIIRPYVDFSYGHSLRRAEGEGTFELRLGGQFW